MRALPCWLALVLAVACGDDDGNGGFGRGFGEPGGACEIRFDTLPICEVNPGVNESNCTDVGGKWLARCPSEGLIGTCTMLEGPFSAVTYYYDGGAEDIYFKEVIQEQCEAASYTWTDA